jgi:hypothetical protein
LGREIKGISCLKRRRMGGKTLKRRRRINKESYYCLRKRKIIKEKKR